MIHSVGDFSKVLASVAEGAVAPMVYELSSLAFNYLNSVVCFLKQTGSTLETTWNNYNITIHNILQSVGPSKLPVSVGQVQSWPILILRASPEPPSAGFWTSSASCCSGFFRPSLPVPCWQWRRKLVVGWLVLDPPTVGVLRCVKIIGTTAWPFGYHRAEDWSLKCWPAWDQNSLRIWFLDDDEHLCGEFDPAWLRQSWISSKNAPQWRFVEAVGMVPPTKWIWWNHTLEQKISRNRWCV